jgi:hypothetical protein
VEALGQWNAIGTDGEDHHGERKLDPVGEAVEEYAARIGGN